MWTYLLCLVSGCFPTVLSYIFALCMVPSNDAFLRLCCWSWTNLSFSDSGELIEFRRAVMLMVMAYYSKRIQIKISKGKRWGELNSSETRHKFTVFLSQVSSTDNTSFSQQWSVTIWMDYYQPGNSTWDLMTRCLLAIGHIGVKYSCDCIYFLSIQPLQVDLLDTSWLKSSIINHIFSFIYLK